MSLDFYVFANLPAEEFNRLWEAADSPEVKLLKTECFFGAQGIRPIEPGSYYDELCHEFGIQAQSLLYVSHNKSEIFTVNQMLYTIFEIVKPHSAEALFQGETLMDVRPDKVNIIPNEQVQSILLGQACRKVYEYGLCFVCDGIKGEYDPHGIVIELQDGTVVNCQRCNYADLVIQFSTLEIEENYEFENYVRETITLFEGYSYETIHAIERDKVLHEYDKLKIIVGNVTICLHMADDELEIHRSVTG